MKYSGYYRVWPLFWDTYFSQFLYQIQKFITFLRMYKNLHVLSILKWYWNVVNYQKWPVCITFCDAGQIAKNTHSRIKFIAIFQSLFVRYVFKIISFLNWPDNQLSKMMQKMNAMQNWTTLWRDLFFSSEWKIFMM